MKNFDSTYDEKLQDIEDKIEVFLRELCEECGERQHTAQQIILQAIIWGAQNAYEGIGILEECKQTYREIIEDCVD